MDDAKLNDRICFDLPVLFQLNIKGGKLILLIAVYKADLLLDTGVI